MSNEQALLNCKFGWGKTCCLYDDSIEIAGKSYNLEDLTSIHPSYRSVFGVSSARLELSFGLDRLVLRGIADLSVARSMVSHLQPYCSTAPQVARLRSRSSRGRNLARAQARAWERTNKMPLILDSPAHIVLTTSSSRLLEDAPVQTKTPGFAEEPPTDEPLSLAAVPKAPVEDTSLTPGETLEAFAQIAANLSTYASPIQTTLWQPPHTPRFQPPLHSVHLIPPNQKFDSGSMPVPVVKSSVLPIIHVPVRLQHGECAHYSIGAVLCSDRISSSARALYPPVDHGLLTLTNRRILYIGKRCQFTLAYTHLWYVSLLHSAIALHIEGQFRRVIVELEHPREWASRIELLSFIGRRSRPRMEPPTMAVPAIPGLHTTVKRPAIKLSVANKPNLADNPTIPLLSKRVVSNIVEADTIEVDNSATQTYIDHKTLDLPSTSVALEDVQKNSSSICECSASPCVRSSRLQGASVPFPHGTQGTTLHSQTRPTFAPIENASTLEFPVKPDATDRPTLELSPSSPQIGLENASTLEFHDQSDTVKMMIARTFSLPDDDDDDSTIHLRERKLSQLRTVSLRERVANKPLTIEKTPRVSRRRR